MNAEKVWSFKTARFEVALYIEPAYYESWGDDETCFDSEVVVMLDGVTIGSCCLEQSFYEADNEMAFWIGHRNPDPMSRNCNFPDMVREAISQARKCLARTPEMRAA